MSKKLKKGKSKPQMSVELAAETPKEVIVNRIGDYLLTYAHGEDTMGFFLVQRPLPTKP